MEELLDRIAAALDAGAATSTDTLQGLLLDIGGEKCWQRPRLINRLTNILRAKRPVMSKSTTHRFKAGFSGKDFTGFPLVVGEKTKMVTASNLTDEDVPLLKQYGGGHLIEPLGAKQETPTPAETNSGILLTAVEETENSTIIKHSSGGPDDLPITAPAAEQEHATIPEALSEEEREQKPAPQADEPAKKKK